MMKIKLVEKSSRMYPIFCVRDHFVVFHFQYIEDGKLVQGMVRFLAVLRKAK